MRTVPWAVDVFFRGRSVLVDNCQGSCCPDQRGLLPDAPMSPARAPRLPVALAQRGLIVEPLRSSLICGYRPGTAWWPSVWTARERRRAFTPRTGSRCLPGRGLIDWFLAEVYPDRLGTGLRANPQANDLPGFFSLDRLG